MNKSIVKEAQNEKDDVCSRTGSSNNFSAACGVCGYGGIRVLAHGIGNCRNKLDSHFRNTDTKEMIPID